MCSAREKCHKGLCPTGSATLQAQYAYLLSLSCSEPSYLLPRAWPYKMLTDFHEGTTASHGFGSWGISGKGYFGQWEGTATGVYKWLLIVWYWSPSTLLFLPSLPSLSSFPQCRRIWPTIFSLNSQWSKCVIVMSTLMSLHRLREQQTPCQLRAYWCSWAQQEVFFPFWFTQAAGVSLSHGTVKFPHLGQDCVQPWHLFSVDAERAVEQGCWVDCGVSVGVSVSLPVV